MTHTATFLTRHFLSNPYHPLYAVALIAVVAAVAWAASHAVPFYRRELAHEGRHRLTPLDGLRGVLCFAVLCHHGAILFDHLDNGTWATPGSRFYNLLGESAVMLFFAATAFLFWSRAVAKDGSLPVGPFLHGRAFRLVPMYLFSTAVVLGVAARHVAWLTWPTARGLLWMGLMGAHLWAPLGDFDVTLVDARVTWSLQYEWGFYLLLPALAPVVVRGNAVALLCGLFAGAVVMFGPGPHLFFFPGIVAAHAMRSSTAVAWLRGRLASVAVSAAAVGLPLSTAYGFGWPALILTTVVFVPISCGNAVFGVLRFRGLRLMGEISYSVYLLHGILLYLARPALARVKHAGPGIAWHYWLAMTGLAVVGLAVSMATYRFVEWPFMQYERRRRATPLTEDVVRPAAEQDGAAPPPGRGRLGRG